MKISGIGSCDTQTTFGSKKLGALFKNKPDELCLSNKKTDEQKPHPLKKFKTVIAAVASSAITALTLFLFFNKKTNDLKAANDNLKDKLDAVVLPENFDTMKQDKIDEIEQGTLAYSPDRPPVIKSPYRQKSYIEAVTLPDVYKKTTNRNDAKKLNYPKFQKGHTYDFQFPASPDMKISHEHTDFTPIPKTQTNISASYADSLEWNDDKISRDLLQNFYDGHGQTLDGVKITMKPANNGEYTVRIQGQSTFLPEKAILLGETSKKDNQKAAGNFGEGLKMVVLKLLQEKGADKVNIASDNWNVGWNLEQNALGKSVLAYQLDKTEPIDGNYIEFNTKDTKFLESLTNTFDRFYHYNNPSFKCPDFENDSLSLKLLPNKEDKGRLYIAGQAFELDGEYEGLNGMSINIKNKPPIKNADGKPVFDPSRDRVSLTSDNIEALGKWIISENNMSKEDAIKLIHSLQEYWDAGTMDAIFKHRTKGVSFICGLFSGAGDRNDLKIAFPEKCIADSFGVSPGIKKMFQSADYKICNSKLKYCGMHSVEELAQEREQHKPVEPTAKEKNKILILQNAVSLMSPVLKKEKFFTDDELKSQIYIYDKNKEMNEGDFAHIEGEAIVDKGKSLGFWLERGYLKDASFASALSTTLHELTHKFGSDESEIFSYKLTDVLTKVFEAIQEDPNLAVQLKVLEQAWDKQNKKAA